MQFNDLYWVANEAKRGKPPFDEADLTDLFEFIDKNEYIIDFKVTVRRYPKNYIVAYWVDWYDEPDPGDIIDYTNDGDGDGIILLSKPSELVIWGRYERRDFEKSCDSYMKILYRHMENVLS